MAKGNLSAAQQAQLQFLQTLPARFERFHRQIEEMASLRANETAVRNLSRALDALRNEASSLTLSGLADTLGMMAMLSRRGGGLQMRVRGLREGLASLKLNYEGALRAASRPQEEPPGDDPEPVSGSAPIRP